ncbi:MAG TPA: Gfo/Idh/MocA family oxidoreductase [Methylomirabilota bacterium]|nr:Gfo/Idh/MocA family oxidoreductase [Methylomirabilota bacterium]
MLRVALVGCGGIGALRARALASAPAYRLAVVSDLVPGRAEALAGRHGATVAADWRAAVSDGGVDVVVVSTPPSSHAEVCVAALGAGKAVLCEKPLARSVAESRLIVEAARRAGRLLATGFNYRFYPSIVKAREVLDSGVIGRLDHVRSYAGYSATEHSQAWLHDATVMGGGVLRDNGIHLIDLTRYFLGEVVEVAGFTSGDVWQFDGCEDNGFALLRNAAGNVASLHASWTEWRGYRLLVEIYGTQGCIRTWCFPMMTEVIAAVERGGRPHRRRHLFPATQLGERLWSYRWVVVRSFVREFEALAGALRGERTPLATGEDGLRTIEIAEAAARRQAAPRSGHAELV